MVVLYYTQTYYLDAVLEIIQSIKRISHLHLLIEVSPESKKSTILDIKSLSGLNPIENIRSVISNEAYHKFLPYLEGIVSIHFVVHKSKRAFSPKSFQVCRQVNKFVSQIHPDVIHFDTVSVRSIGLLFLTKKYKTNITVHDPLPHSGESSWKKNLTKHLFYRRATHFLFYSEFAEKQFIDHYPNLNVKTSLLRFQPFSFMSEFHHSDNPYTDYILFFGRMSPYKGIDILLDAIPDVLSAFPNAKFILAGNTDNYHLDHDTLNYYKDVITIIPEYLSADRLSDLIAHSKFIVCPYRDATQSGVLMTSFAFGKTVLATNVGAFPEYISDGINGILMEPNPSSVSSAICRALNGDYYKQLEQHVMSEFSSVNDQRNQEALTISYLGLD